ncbi:Alpha/Beta hydrolase protein [Butyriboletus roseoflavus]|nr:Alpha/Beta hydrolase protein [Butyriboletus roseoflavus]
MALVDHLDVSYSPSAPLNTFRTFDVHVPKHQLIDQSDTPGLICFIHGGAWRAEDKADHAALARKLATSTGFPVALPNYRLTPRDPTPDNYLRHPTHASDALQFLEFILSWHKENGGGLPRKPSKLFLIGHSCSAHMLCSVFLRMPGDSVDVCPSDELVQSTAAIIMSEGIYDIDILLSSFPSYRSWFIENTFGQRDSFENVSAIKATTNPKGQHIRWFIIHSKGDTLVDERQSEGMYDSLREKSCLVTKSFDDLEDEHSDILIGPKYIAMIDSYIKRAVDADAV